MKIRLGHDFFEAKTGKRAPVELDTTKLINGHLILMGASGTGKSYTIRRMVNQASTSKVKFYIFDVHGDLDIPGASVVQFSEQAPFGLNPLRVNPDPDFGGVRKCIQSFIRTINQASTTALGLKQESVLRNLLQDVFRDFGFDPENANTWGVNSLESNLVSGGSDNRLYLTVTIQDKDKVKALGARWDPDKKLWWVHTDKYVGMITQWAPAFKGRAYPTLKDVLNYARRIHVERFMGSDQKSVRELIAFNKVARTFNRKLLDSVKKRHIDGVEHLGLDPEDEEKLEAARVKVVESYTDYVYAIRTGNELNTLIKYDSPDVLKSVVDRLSNLNATGIYKDTMPPFDPSVDVWRYKLNALSAEEKKMFVLFTLQDIFLRAVQRGEQSDVTEVIVLDELSTYTSTQDEKGDGIIGIISREARKYGLALWAANQSPSGIPESLISSVATKIVLGIDEMYWISAASKLRIEQKQLAWIQTQKTLAVQMKERGATKNRWWWVQLD